MDDLSSLRSVTFRLGGSSPRTAGLVPMFGYGVGLARSSDLITASTANASAGARYGSTSSQVFFAASVRTSFMRMLPSRSSSTVSIASALTPTSSAASAVASGLSSPPDVRRSRMTPTTNTEPIRMAVCRKFIGTGPLAV